MTWVAWAQTGIVMSSAVSSSVSEYDDHHDDNAAEDSDNGSDDSDDYHDHIIIIANNYSLKSNFALCRSLFCQFLGFCQKCYCWTL